MWPGGGCLASEKKSSIPSLIADLPVFLFVFVLIFLILAVFPDTVCDGMGINQRAELGDLFEARLLIC
jgi:hypothetical protein